MNLALDKRNFFPLIITLIVVFSGYFYIAVGQYAQEINRVYRFGFILILFALIISRITTTYRWKIPETLIALFIPIIYMLMISLLRNQPEAYLSVSIRWVSYFAFAIYIFNIENPLNKLTLYFRLSSFFYLIMIFADLLLERWLEINGANRIVGSIGSPIGFAGTLMVSILGILFLRSCGIKHRLDKLLIAGLFFGIIMTATRSIIVATLILILLLTIYQQKNILKKLSYSIIAAIIISAFGFIIIAYTDIGNRFLLFSEGLSTDSSTGFRIMLLHAVIHSNSMIDTIFGLGLGGFPGWFEQQTSLPNVAPHFEFIWLYTEGGMIGTSLYLFFTLYVITVICNAYYKGAVSKNILFFGLLFLLIQQGPLQLANPGYFYQIMIPVYLITGYILRVIGKAS